MLSAIFLTARKCGETERNADNVYSGIANGRLFTKKCYTNQLLIYSEDGITSLSNRSVMQKQITSDSDLFVKQI